MVTKPNLEELASFVEKEAEKQKVEFFIGSDVKDTIKILEQISKPISEEITLTVGEINAYLG